MNTTRLATGIALAAALGTSAVSANISTGSLYQDVQSAIRGSGQVNITLADGVATLTGNVSSAISANAVRNAALAHPSVDRVIDLIDHR